MDRLDKVYGHKLDGDKESASYVRAYWARWKAIFNGNLDVPVKDRSTDAELREKMRASVKGLRAELAGDGASKAAIKPDHAVRGCTLDEAHVRRKRTPRTSAI